MQWPSFVTDDDMLLQTTPNAELDVDTGKLDTQPTSVSLLNTASLHEQLHEQDGSVAWEIEARLLAGQSDEVIADQLGIPVVDIADYVAAHFDFRADLGRDTWLFLNAVQGRLTPGEELTEGDIWRLVAWLYGPVGLNLIIDDYRGLTDPENTEATVLANLFRAQALIRFVDPRSRAYADALRLTRKRFSRRRDASARQIAAQCDLLLVTAGWNPKGKGRLTSKARREAIDQLTDEQLAEQIQKAWDKIKEMR